MASPSYRAGYRGDGMRAWRTANASLGNRVTYFLYDELSGQLQYELEPSGAAYVLRNVYGFGAAGLAQRFRPQDSNLLTTLACDPSGNTVARSVSSGTAAIGIGAPDDVALYDGCGYPVADVTAKTPGYVSATGPTGYGVGMVYSVGFGRQFGYYTENNTQLATSNVRDRGLLLCTHRYYDPINARWLNRDPAGYDGDINLYGYCDGNPVMMADPDGTRPLTTEDLRLLHRIWLAKYHGEIDVTQADVNRSIALMKHAIASVPQGEADPAPLRAALYALAYIGNPRYSSTSGNLSDTTLKVVKTSPKCNYLVAKSYALGAELGYGPNGVPVNKTGWGNAYPPVAQDWGSKGDLGHFATIAQSRELGGVMPTVGDVVAFNGNGGHHVTISLGGNILVYVAANVKVGTIKLNWVHHQKPPNGYCEITVKRYKP